MPLNESKYKEVKESQGFPKSPEDLTVGKKISEGSAEQVESVTKETNQPAAETSASGAVQQEEAAPVPIVEEKPVPMSNAGSTARSLEQETPVSSVKEEEKEDREDSQRTHMVNLDDLKNIEVVPINDGKNHAVIDNSSGEMLLSDESENVNLNSLIQPNSLDVTQEDLDASDANIRDQVEAARFAEASDFVGDISNLEKVSKRAVKKEQKKESRREKNESNEGAVEAEFKAVNAMTKSRATQHNQRIEKLRDKVSEFSVTEEDLDKNVDSAVEKVEQASAYVASFIEKESGRDMSNEERRALREGLYVWFLENPGLLDSKSVFWGMFGFDQEAFMQESPDRMSKYSRLGEESEGVGVNDIDTSRQDKAIDTMKEDFKKGFFHVAGEHVSRKLGRLAWSPRVENSMKNVMSEFGYTSVEDQTDMDNIRNVFRLVRLYASLSVDRKGHVFKEGKDKFGIDSWQLTEDEFCDICNMIVLSINQNGHPLGFVRYENKDRYTLRGTTVYPAGYMPKVLRSWCMARGENSKMSVYEDDVAFANAIRSTWYNDTYKAMRQECVNMTVKTLNEETGKYEDIERNLVAQRVVIEDFIRALADLDGQSMSTIEETLGIRDTMDFKITEYEDMNKKYAQTMHGRYGADDVAKNADRHIKILRQNQRNVKGVNKEGRKDSNRDGDTVFYELGGKVRQGRLSVGLNLITSAARINALLGQPILALASMEEKAVANALTKVDLELMRTGKVTNWIVNNTGEAHLVSTEEFQVSQWVWDLLKTDESIKAVDAMKMLVDITGEPSAMRLFAQTGMELTHENVTKFVNEQFLRDESILGTGRARLIAKKLNSASQKLLVGDLVFKKSDSLNWFRAFLAANQIQAAQLRKIEQQNPEFVLTNTNTMPLTGAEIESGIRAVNGNMAAFFSQALSTDAGVSAFSMMRGNNIAQVNPLSYYVNRFLHQHGATNFAITMFIDTFPIYGINFIWNVIPMSRTFGYIWSQKSKNREVLSEGVIGGNMEYSTGDNYLDAENFTAGLKMNLLYDAGTIGKNVVIAVLLGAAMCALGYEPPEDPQNAYNSSMCRIGKNFHLGGTDEFGNGIGVEVSQSWWLNDLTQWGLPLAHLVAGAMSGFEPDMYKAHFWDSLHTQIDGNVLLDITDIVSNWQETIAEFNEFDNRDSMSSWDQHKIENPFSEFGYGVTDMALKAINKLTPGQPLYATYVRNAWVLPGIGRGEDARASDARHVFDEEGKKVLTDFSDFQIRRYTMVNPVLGFFENVMHGSLDPSVETTGYQWWEMPIKTVGDDLSYVAAQRYYMDEDTYPPQFKSAKEYRNYMADMLIDDISNGFWGETPDEAVKNGCIIPWYIRKIAAKRVSKQIEEIDTEIIKAEWAQKNDEISWAAMDELRQTLKKEKSARYDILNDWLQNDRIPASGEVYEQLLTSYEKTYVYKDTGRPALGIFDVWDPNIECIWVEKGDHPSNWSPLSIVDYRDRGYDAETINYWYDEPEGEKWQKEGNVGPVLKQGGTDLSWLEKEITDPSTGKKTRMLDQIVPYGPNAGMKLEDALYGRKSSSERNTFIKELQHPGDPTINRRSYVWELERPVDELGRRTVAASMGGAATEPDDDSDSSGKGSGKKKAKINSKLSPKIGDDIKSIKPKDKDDLKAELEDILKKDTAAKNKKKWPSYRKSYGYSRSGGGGSSYEPKIYSNHSSLNPDRPNTMYSSTPYNANTTYLRPDFVTKGSRESYKRSDI